MQNQLIKSGNYDPSKSTSWKVLETVLSHLKLSALNLVLSAREVDNVEPRVKYHAIEIERESSNWFSMKILVVQNLT